MSDAYETHNMGIRYTGDSAYANLDLGIVSPDMLLFKNKYRNSNRSYGEILTLEVGQVPVNNRNWDGYFRLRIADDFGLFEAQKLFHKTFALQQTDHLHEIHMPDRIWYGAGIRRSSDLEILAPVSANINFDAYIGTDAVYGNVQLDIKQRFSEVTSATYAIGTTAKAFDEVVSAGPIYADARKLIPYMTFELRTQLNSIVIYANETVSVPTIHEDHRPYLLFGMGIIVSH